GLASPGSRCPTPPAIWPSAGIMPRTRARARAARGPRLLPGPDEDGVHRLERDDRVEILLAAHRAELHHAAAGLAHDAGDLLPRAHAHGDARAFLSREYRLEGIARA